MLQSKKEKRLGLREREFTRPYACCLLYAFSHLRSLISHPFLLSTHFHHHCPPPSLSIWRTIPTIKPIISAHFHHHCPLPFLSIWPTIPTIKPITIFYPFLDLTHPKENFTFLIFWYRSETHSFNLIGNNNHAWSHPWLEHGFFGLRWNGFVIFCWN